MLATSEVKIITQPTVIPIAEMKLDHEGLERMRLWVEENVPGVGCSSVGKLWGRDRQPFEDRVLNNTFAGYTNGETSSDNELLVELWGRKCYNSFAKKAGRASNADYTARLHGQPGKIPHASVFYHAKMSFLIAGISRRVSLELIRHYVGADREIEGSPSQESTRYTHHAGIFCAHPRDVEAGEEAMQDFEHDMSQAYFHYTSYLAKQWEKAKQETGEDPKGMVRKRIYECAAGRLPNQAATSLGWTTNPAALAKLFRERCDDASDLEFQRLAKMWREIAYARWPNLFRDSNPSC